MCHNDVAHGLPEPGAFTYAKGEISSYVSGPDHSAKRLAVLTDIYGCNTFYRAFATRYALQGFKVSLVDIFAEFGELAAPTRELAFERRHKLRDKAFIDALEIYLKGANINSVIGFCFGGLCVYELARRDFPASMVSIYGFPQGLTNQDPLPVPLTYLAGVSRRHLSLVGGADVTIPAQYVKQLSEIAGTNPAVGVRVFEQSGHGFMGDLAHEDKARRDIALEALAACDGEVQQSPRSV